MIFQGIRTSIAKKPYIFVIAYFLFVIAAIVEVLIYVLVFLCSTLVSLAEVLYFNCLLAIM